MVELDGHSGLSVSAEQLSGSETTSRSGRCGSDARSVSSARGDHLINSSLMDERSRRFCVQQGAQLNRDVVETSLWRDNRVVNVASSMVTTPLIRSGPCSGMRGASMRCSWAKVSLGRGRRAPNRSKPRAWPLGCWQKRGLYRGEGV